MESNAGVPMKTPSELSEKMELLERSVMELGTEVYSLRSTVTKGKQHVEQVLSVFQGLKRLLDEKGLVTVDDFDAAVELGEVLEQYHTNLGNPGDEIERLKKTGH